MPSQFKIFTNQVLLFFIVTVALFMTRCETENRVASLIKPEKVFEIVNDSTKVNNYLILDTRHRLDYVRGHLVSAIWMGVDSIPKYLSLLKSEKRTIILYDSAGIESLRAAILLLKNGITNFYIIDGGFSQWMKNGYPAAIQLVINTSSHVDIKKKDIKPEQLLKIIQDNNPEYAVIDLRPKMAYKEFHIQGAISIPYVPLNEFVVGVEEQNFSRNKHIVVYCDEGTSDIGEKATDVLLRNRYINVYLLEGGVEEWYRKKYPLIADAN
jgi:rhodanese-related sulfurtransferase